MIQPEPGPPELHGERVLLRPYGQGFGEAELRRVYQWSRDDELLQLSGGAPLRLPYGQFVQEFWRERAREGRRRLLYGIFAGDGLLIGRLGVFALDRRRRQAELGILIGDRAYWGQGYGTDAMRTLLGYLFRELGYARIYLYTGRDNLRAQRAFARVGFRRLGTVRRVFSDLHVRDDVHMEIRPRDLEGEVRRESGEGYGLRSA